MSVYGLCYISSVETAHLFR